ncbi:MAG: hypothetical protein GF381_04370 [Candidatus Pacebacteria bacterium]|nr:hypothetical protein [Candidatus Paceibacterota bacterium]
MADDTKKLTAAKTDKLEAGKTEQLEPADELALDALSQASKNSDATDVDEEAASSDEFAETLNSLQNLIEAKATKLMNLKNEMKQKRQMIRDVFTNDAQLQEAEEKKEEIYTAYKERKNIVKEQPEIKRLKDDLRQLKEDQKDIEESLSTHLINYHQITNSTSFDTSEGDQWEFNIKAKVKNKKV